MKIYDQRARLRHQPVGVVRMVEDSDPARPTRECERWHHVKGVVVADDNLMGTGKVAELGGSLRSGSRQGADSDVTGSP